MTKFVWQRSVVDASGGVIPAASVEVRDSITAALVQLYSDVDGNDPIGNPIATDAVGFVRFYAGSGRYNISATSGALVRTWMDVRFGTAGSEVEYEPIDEEVLLGVTIVNKSYRPLHPYRYGTNVTEGTSDLRAAIQAAVNVAHARAAAPYDGATVPLPAGILGVSGPVELYSNVRLLGDGWTNTIIKALPGASFAANQAVVQSIDFETTQGTNKWNYYAPYPAGLTMGIGIDQVSIDAADVAPGCLHLYGGKIKIGTIGLMNSTGHAIWTECGIPGSSTSGDDYHDFVNMHESSFDTVFIVNAGKHGWLYRGPNDSHIGEVQAKTCGWGGFHQESTGNNSVGNLEIGSVHAYSCGAAHDADGAMVTLVSALVQRIYSDASFKNGVKFTGACIVDQIVVLQNNQSNAGEFFGVKCDVATQIGMIRNIETTARTSGSDGGLLQLNFDGSVIGQVRSTQVGATTIEQKGIEVNAQATIGVAQIEGYNSVGSVALELNADRLICVLQAKSCETALEFNDAGRHCIIVDADSCTNDIVYNVPAGRTDEITLLSTQLPRSYRNVGMLTSAGLNLEITDVSSATSYTPDLQVVSTIRIASLAHNITFNAPTNGTKGDLLLILLQQDGTGGRTVTFNAVYHHGYNDTGNTAGMHSSIEFIFDGTVWKQRSRSAWHA